MSGKMTILDGHIHVGGGKQGPDQFRSALREAGVSGGIVISRHPDCFGRSGGADSASDRLDDLFRWTGGEAALFPFFWIDPLEADALLQVDLGVERGVSGFKVICDRYYPSDARAMRVFRRIAERGKPMLFHSGILWDGKPSGEYNRPVNFETLLEVPGLRFALAHISWPWCDECVAVYGKYQNARTNRPDLSVEMFIDLTPGTPPIYRREALRRLLTVGYDIERNLVFGTDCVTSGYNVKWSREWVRRDMGVYRGLRVPKQTLAGIFGENLRRFVGVSKREAGHRALKPAES